MRGHAAAQQQAAERRRDPAVRLQPRQPVDREAGAGGDRRPPLDVAEVAIPPRPRLAGVFRKLSSIFIVSPVTWSPPRAVPMSAVHDGESLAGNDSSDASWTMSLARQPRPCSAPSTKWRAIGSRDGPSRRGRRAPRRASRAGRRRSRRGARRHREPAAPGGGQPAFAVVGRKHRVLAGPTRSAGCAIRFFESSGMDEIRSAGSAAAARYNATHAEILRAFAGVVAWRHSCRRSRPSFDVLIRNARVMDGTGNPWLRADVGIPGDRITAVGPLANATAAQTIDAARSHRRARFHRRPLARRRRARGRPRCIRGSR